MSEPMRTVPAPLANGYGPQYCDDCRRRHAFLWREYGERTVGEESDLLYRRTTAVGDRCEARSRCVGAAACFPIVERNPVAFRYDLSRTAIQTIVIDVELCRTKAAEEVARKTQSHARQSTVRMLGNADWKKADALLEH